MEISVLLVFEGFDEENGGWIDRHGGYPPSKKYCVLLKKLLAFELIGNPVSRWVD